MALNFSHRPIFSGHLSEDNLVDPIRMSNGGYLVEGIPENNVGAFGESWHLNSWVEDCYEYGREICDRNGSQESVSKDIIDLLPSDPFGMDISSTFTAITGWLEDLEADYGGYRRNEVGVSSGDYQLFAGLNFIWNNAMKFQAFQGNMEFDYKPSAANWYGGCSGQKEVENVPCFFGFGSTCNMEGVTSGYSSMQKEIGHVSCPVGFASACNMEGVTSGYSSREKEVGHVSCPIGFTSACNMEGVTSGYFSREKEVGRVSCPIGFTSACNMEGINSGYSLEDKGFGNVSCPIGFGSACNMEGVTSRYMSEEKEIRDVSCPIGCTFGSACNMEGITSGYCSEEKGIGDVFCPVRFGAACNVEEITSGYDECSEEKGVRDVSCPISFRPAYNIEEITGGYGTCLEKKGVRDLSCSVGYMEDILNCSNDRTDIIQYQTKEWQEGFTGSCFDYTVEACLGEAPHLVLGLAIGYLGVRDLLSVESVCRYLRATVKSESYLWTRIHIDQPLNEKITDDLLLQLTDRAQGELQSLSLVECPKITDDGLMRVLESNPKLNKLSLPGCSKLTIEGIVNNLKAFKSTGAAGVKHLKLGLLYGVEKYFEELKLLLGIDGIVQQNGYKPHFYHMRHFYLSCDDDDRALDIETCPRCDRLRLIYDCTAEGCQKKEQSPQVCRACTICIERCYKCGRCVNDGEYEETFCLEWLCSFCKRREDPSKSGLGSPNVPRLL